MVIHGDQMAGSPRTGEVNGNWYIFCVYISFDINYHWSAGGGQPSKV